MIIPIAFIMLFIHCTDAASFYIEKDIYVPGHKQFYIRTHYPFIGTPVDFIAEMEEEPEELEECSWEVRFSPHCQRIRNRAKYYKTINRVILKLAEPTQWDQEEDEEFCRKYLPKIYKSGGFKELQPRTLCHRMLHSKRHSKSCSYLDEFEDLLDFKDCREKQLPQQKDSSSDVSDDDDEVKNRKIEHQKQVQLQKVILQKAISTAFVKDDSLGMFRRIQYPIGRDESGFMQYDLLNLPRIRSTRCRFDNMIVKRMSEYSDYFDSQIIINEHCLDDTPDPFADFDFDRSQGMELKPADRPVKNDKSYECSSGRPRSTGNRKSTGGAKNDRQENISRLLISLFAVYIEEPIKSFFNFGVSPAGPVDLCMSEDK